MEGAPHTLGIAIHHFAEAWTVELAHRDPSSQARMAPVRGLAGLDPIALAAEQGVDDAYGALLAAQLFSDPAVVEHFLRVESVAEAGSRPLRISIQIDPSAQELHALRWELLRHPRTGARLATSERVVLSRFMVSRDWRPVRLRPRGELRALIAVAAPVGPKMSQLRLAPVDGEGEAARAGAALAGLRPQVLGVAGTPCTLDGLLAALRDGVDVLYLVAHGSFSRNERVPLLMLQGASGDVEVARGDRLAESLAELQSPPRVIVLASCEGAGDGGPIGAAERSTVQATLAWRLADAGVAAVLAMQGQISMETVQAFMPVLFEEMLRDGWIDRAVAVARGSVRDRPDAWMPALYTRLEDGLLWYTPGFRGAAPDAVWRRLVQPVQEGKVVPILGPGLLEHVQGTTLNIAREIATASQFPLADHEWDDLPRVNQFLSVKESRFNVLRTYQERVLEQLLARHGRRLPEGERPPVNPAPKLGRVLALVGDLLRTEDPDEPHARLAQLPASVYVTTNYDPLLERALKAAGREPQQLLTRWRHRTGASRVAEGVALDVSAPRPLVYHAFGAFGADTDDTLVMTEDNFFDYLIATASERLTPAVVEGALVHNSLIFLGFRLTDWSFRVLFRLMMSLPGRGGLKDFCHVAVQLDPEIQSMEDVNGTKTYLAEYFGKEANIDIYWGSPREFLQALHAELAREGGAAAVAADEKRDEWDF